MYLNYNFTIYVLLYKSSSVKKCGQLVKKKNPTLFEISHLNTHNSKWKLPLVMSFIKIIQLFQQSDSENVSLTNFQCNSRGTKCLIQIKLLGL